MMLWRGFLVWLMLAIPVAAQQAPTPTPVLIIDSERLFAETRYGRRIAADLAAHAADVQAENDRIVAKLTEEERSLTIRRPDMTPEAFRIAAEAFDAKVQEVRRERDAKNVELQRTSAENRLQFEERVQGIVANIMLERGASLVLEQRTVVLSVRAANITDAVIARVDATLGDGRD
ncbi:OmpH family outer membrane protein [Yoonia sp.]|uniref:OmpH family outer membrane protein n=1 Tax=Yoonia sp. TaxID=2212373 RepID=UPI0019EC5917|nr:OmpH family outer membrane protein [Yoonia sp.]MBE0414069.1 OmpH family outer membrane protein [Yoonia sp.]